MRLAVLLGGALVSVLLGIALSIFLWFAGVQNSSMSHTKGEQGAHYARSAKLFYWGGWGSLILGVGGGVVLLFRANELEKQAMVKQAHQAD